MRKAHLRPSAIAAVLAVVLAGGLVAGPALAATDEAALEPAWATGTLSVGSNQQRGEVTSVPPALVTEEIGYRIDRYQKGHGKE